MALTTAKKPWRPAKMTGWYDPGQLARTASQVVVSTTLGQHADFRLVETLASPQHTIHDYSQKDEIWIDYVADLGDGWNSTYSVAYYLAQPKLQIGSETLERGQLLVFGGDQVYPTADRDAYDQRLVQPYETALRKTTEPHPHLFAIPGNHDWYDSLASFTRLFCNERWIGGWQTKQKRSYFALRLPHGWWLLGTDVQLNSDIDIPQVEYFREVAKQMKPGDRVILCNAEPHWIFAKMYGELDPNASENNLRYLEEKVLPKNIAVFIAGDLHHYRRHEGPGNAQKITAGGGGAFLHPTHGPDVQELSGGFTHQKSYPDEKTSRGLCWGNLLFPLRNPTFGLLTGLLYVLTAWTGMAHIGEHGLGKFGTALSTSIETAINSPQAVFWILAIVGGFFLFTDTHSKWYRFVAGFLHGMAHLAATFFIGWWATYVTVSTWEMGFRKVEQLLAAGALIFAVGWLVGALLMGFYLFVSLNIFRRHTNEAFSSLKIEDWKSFLRMKISKDGSLTIHPIGIRKVATKWNPAPTTGGPEMVPDGGTAPELIEGPIRLP